MQFILDKYNQNKLIHYLAVICFSIIPLYAKSQFQVGWYNYKTDSLLVKMYRENGLIKTVGEYPNQQIKFIRISKKSQILDTVHYFSKDGHLISKVDYNTLDFELIDSSFLTNYNFTHSALALIQKQIDYNFGNSGILKYFFFDTSNSSQFSPTFNKYSVVPSKLYEPVSYSISHFTFLINIKPEYQSFSPPINQIKFRIDSNLKISGSNIDLQKQYFINYDIDFAESIKSKFKFQDFIDYERKRTIKTTGPYLEIRKKQFYWIIKRQAGTLVNKNNLDLIDFDDYIEEIQINIESGKVEKNMKYVRMSPCF